MHGSSEHNVQVGDTGAKHENEAADTQSIGVKTTAAASTIHSQTDHAHLPVHAGEDEEELFD